MLYKSPNTHKYRKRNYHIVLFKKVSLELSQLNIIDNIWKYMELKARSIKWENEKLITNHVINSYKSLNNC